MASVRNTEERDCRCGSCPTSATITTYDCGCVTVELHDETSPCEDCSNLSGEAVDCGESGDPETHGEEE